MSERQRAFDTAIPWLTLATFSLALLSFVTGGTLLIMGRDPLGSREAWAVLGASAGGVLFAVWPRIARRMYAERLLKVGVWVVLMVTCLQFVAAHVIWADALRPPIEITQPDSTAVWRP